MKRLSADGKGAQGNKCPSPISWKFLPRFQRPMRWSPCLCCGPTCAGDCLKVSLIAPDPCSRPTFRQGSGGILIFPPCGKKIKESSTEFLHGSCTMWSRWERSLWISALTKDGACSEAAPSPISWMSLEDEPENAEPASCS